VTATAEQQNKVRELSDRILNETMGRVNGLAKGLLHVTTLARNETEKLNAERKSCTETLLNTTAALSEQIEGFKQVLHQNVAQATEQITKKSQLAVELVDEPLQRKVRECTQDLNGMIERSADELAERIAAIDRAVTQTCERKIAETSSSLRSNVDNLVQQATSRCQDAVREILGSLARPLQSDKRS
jgi:DNA-binding ferritin-like protein